MTVFLGKFFCLLFYTFSVKHFACFFIIFCKIHKRQYQIHKQPLIPSLFFSFQLNEGLKVWVWLCSAAEMPCEMWDRFFSSQLMFSPTTLRPLVNRLHVKETIMIRTHSYPQPGAFITLWYIGTLLLLHWLTHMCNNGEPGLIDLQTWHLLSKSSPLQLQELWHQNNGKTLCAFCIGSDDMFNICVMVSTIVMPVRRVHEHYCFIRGLWKLWIFSNFLLRNVNWSAVK